MPGLICMGRMVFPNGLVYRAISRIAKPVAARMHILFTRWTGELACCHWDFFWGKKLDTKLALPGFIIKQTPGLINPNMRKMCECLPCSPAISRFLYKKCHDQSWECSKWLTYRTFSLNVCFFHTSYLLYTRPQEMLSNIICHVYKPTLSNYLRFFTFCDGTGRSESIRKQCVQ